MRYENMTKRILSLVLAVAMLVSFLPAVQWVVEAEASEIATVASDRSTKYLSSSTGGSEYLGYGNSANKPEKVSASNLPSKIKSYLSQGYNVMLKRGDVWELPEYNDTIVLSGLKGTEGSPLVVGAYGEGDDPVIAFLKRIKDSSWTLVDSANNIYSASVSDWTGYYVVITREYSKDKTGVTQEDDVVVLRFDDNDWCVIPGLGLLV